MHIRTASLADAAALAAVEAACFPPAEAATAAEITDRLAYYADHFWILEEDDGTLVSFVDGMTTDEPTLRDEMYETAALHDEDGALADDLRRQHPAGLPPPGLCRAGAGAGDRRRPGPGKTRLRPHL